MNLKAIVTIVTLCTTLIMQCCEMHNAITIRPATFDDINAISAISHQYYRNSFAPLWTKHYAPMMPATHDIDAFVQEKAAAADTSNKDFITKQADKQNCRLLVAEIATVNAPKKITGYCRFEQKDPQTMYINFIVVDETLRKQGIAKQLALAAMNTFDGVTECNFRALAHNDFVNDLYSNHGCINKGTVSLDFDTGKISTDPTAPITHIDYSYTIKK